MDLHRLIRNLGYEFSEKQQLLLALTHRSAGSRNNERLEFLGDAILGMVISDALFHRFPEEKEGVLTRLRASLVKGETLAAIARELELSDFVQLGPGELKSGGFRRDSILADSLEAIIGAIYLDGGLDAVTPFIHKLFAERLARCNPKKVLKDPKTRLQEYLQSRGETLPDYEVVNIMGKEHAQTFEVLCHIPLLAKPVTGCGSSRRKAEQAAAETALDELNK